jgi:hypothetical protein
VDEAIDLFIKARTANPRVWNFSYALAGALGLKGDLEGGKRALAESLKLKPEVIRWDNGMRSCLGLARLAPRNSGRWRTRH